MTDMKCIRLSFKIIAFLLLLAVYSPVFAAGERNEKSPEEPVNISSDSFEADRKTGVYLFKGNVVVKQKGGVIMSEFLTVYYDDEKKMDKIVATGDVKINQADRVGTCRKATFFPEEEKIVMEEDPRLWREGDIVEGDMITIFMNDDKINVVNARVVIQPNGNSRKKETSEEGAVTETDKTSDD